MNIISLLDQPHSSQQNVTQVVKPQIGSAAKLEDLNKEQSSDTEDKKRQERVAGWMMKYQVLEFLGYGSFGLVFKVQNIEKQNSLSANQVRYFASKQRHSQGLWRERKVRRKQ
jgi:hypothetical protein